MAKLDPSAQLSKDKKDTIDNLKAIQMILSECVDEGMMDVDDTFYNEINDLIDEAHLIKAKEELAEVVTKAKTLEIDIDAWLSIHRKETSSLSWPIVQK